MRVWHTGAMRLLLLMFGLALGGSVVILADLVL